MTRFETSADGPKATSTKITDVQGVLVEEVLSDTEQEDSTQPDTSEVTIEEVIDTEGKRFRTTGIIDPGPNMALSFLNKICCIRIHLT